MTPKEKQELILEYVRTIAVVVGVVFGLLQLQAIANEDARLRIENTSQMMSEFSEPEFADAALAMITATSKAPTRENFLVFLRDLTPLGQHLQSWAACIDLGLCEEEKSEKVFCRRLLSYEREIEKVFGHYSAEYRAEARDEIFWGRLGACQTTHGELVEKK